MLDANGERQRPSDLNLQDRRGSLLAMELLHERFAVLHQ
jgi:hypothetical protein